MWGFVCEALWDNGELRHVVHSQQGVPQELVDERGKLVWQGSFDDWGRLIAEQGTTTCRLRLPGQIADDETGLHYNRFRYYSPDVGQFVSADPIGFAGGANHYRFSPNGVNWTDPLGLNCTDDACQTGRSGALNQAKRDLGIPRAQHPQRVDRVPMTRRDGSRVIGPDGKPMMTREYTYVRPDGSTAVIQDHSAGHQFGEGGVGDQGPHFNVRPPENTRTGAVPGTQEHYPFTRSST